MPQQYTRAQFAQQLKSKYPQYAEMDDEELTNKILAKYPQYQESIVQEEPAVDTEVTEPVESVEEEIQEEPQTEEVPEEEQLTTEEHNERQAIAAKAIAKSGAAGVGGQLAAFVDDTLGTNIAGQLISSGANLASGVAQIVNVPDAWEAFEYSAVQLAANIQGAVTGDGSEQDFDTPEERAVLKQEIEETYKGDDYLKKVSEDADPFKKRYNGGIIENYAAGNIIDATAQLVDQSVAAAPSLVAAMYGGPVGLGLITASSFGNAFEENYKEDPEAATWKLFGASANTAAWELISESITAGLGGRIKAASKVLGKESGKKLAFESAKKIAGEFGLEGSSEAISEIASMLGDKAILDKDIPKNWLSNVLDTFLVGGILGAGGAINSLPPAGQNYVKQRLKPEEVVEQDDNDLENGQKDTKAKIIINKDANKPQGQKDTETSLLDDALEDKKSERIERDKENEKVVNDLEPAEMEVIVKERAKIDKAKAILNDPNATHSAKDAAFEVKRKAEKKLNQEYAKPAAEQELDLRINEKNDEHKTKLKELRAKQAKLLADKKAYDSAEKPNPAFNEKFKVEMSQINDQVKDINQVIENNSKLKSDLRPDKVGDYKDLVEAKQELLKKRNEGEKLTKKEQKLLKKAYDTSGGADVLTEFLKGDSRAKAEKLAKAENNELVSIIKGKNSQSTKTLAHNALKKANKSKIASLETAVLRHFQNKTLTGKSPITLKEIKSAVNDHFNKRLKDFDPTSGTDFGSYLGIGFQKGGAISRDAFNIVKDIQGLRRDIHTPRAARKLTDDQQATVDFFAEQYKSGALTEADINREGVFQTDTGKFIYREPKGFEKKLSEEGIADEASKVLDENYAVDATSAKSKQAVTRLAQLSDNNVDVLKTKIGDAYNKPGFPSPVDEVKFRKALHKEVGKPVQKKLESVMGKGKALKQFIENNTGDIYDALPAYALRGDSFGGLFTDGNPQPSAWTEYFNNPKRLRALKKAIVNNTIDNYVDEAIEETERGGFGEFDFKKIVRPPFSESQWKKWNEGIQRAGKRAFNFDAWMNKDKSLDLKSLPEVVKDAAYTQGLASELINKLTKAWPGVDVKTSYEFGEQILAKQGYTPEQIYNIAGFKTSINGKPVVWLNQYNQPADTPIHEFGHLWLQSLKENNPKLYKQGENLIKYSRYYNELKEEGNYDHLSEEKFLEEAMATGIGYRGTEIFESQANQSKWDKFIKNLWNSIKSAFGIKRANPEMTLTDFFETATQDILEGGKLTEPLATLANNNTEIAAKIQQQTLEAFDFDDTLFTSNSQVIINKADGSQDFLDTADFPGHKLKKGESYDFAQFNEVIDPKALPMLNRLKDAVKGGKDVTILTAREMKAGPAVKATLDAFGIDSNKVKFKGVGHSSAEAKANYLSNAIDKYGYSNVFFADDALKNVDAVAQVLVDKGVKGVSELVQPDLRVLSGKEKQETWGYEQEKFKPAAVISTKGLSTKGENAQKVAREQLKNELTQVINQSFRKIGQGKPVIVITGGTRSKKDKYGDETILVEGSDLTPAEWKSQALIEAAADFGLIARPAPYNSGILRISTTDYLGNPILGSELNVTPKGDIYEEAKKQDPDYTDEFIDEILQEEASELVDLNQEVFTIAENNVIRHALGLPLIGSPSPATIDLRIAKPKGVQITPAKFEEVKQQYVEFAQNLPQELTGIATIADPIPPQAVRKSDEDLKKGAEMWSSFVRSLPIEGVEAIKREWILKLRPDRGISTLRNIGLTPDNIREFAAQWGSESLINALETDHTAKLDEPGMKEALDRYLKQKKTKYENAGKVYNEADITADYLKNKGFGRQVEAIIDAFLQSSRDLGLTPTVPNTVDWSQIAKPGKNDPKNLAAKRNMLKLVAKHAGQMIKNGDISMETVMKLGSMVAENPNSFLRDSARTKYQSTSPVQKKKGNPVRYEHIQPASAETWPAVVKAAVDPNVDFDTTFNKIMENYFVVDLGLAYDEILDKVYKYNSPIDIYDVVTGKAPHPFDGKIPASFARYMNSNVFVNPFTIENVETGETLANELGLDPALAELFPKLEGVGPDGNDLMLKVVKKPNKSNKKNVDLAAKNAETAKKARTKKMNSIRNLLKDATTAKEYLTPEVATILEHTSNDFSERGGTLKDSELTSLATSIRDLLNDAKSKKGLKEKHRKRYNDYLTNKVNDLVTDKSGIEGKVSTSRADYQNRQRRVSNFFGDVFKGTSNKDFYSMLYDLLPTDNAQARQDAKDWQNKHIIQPLEDANNEYIQNKWNVQKDFVNLLKKYDLNSRLKEKSGIEVDGIPLTVDEVLDVFTHVGNPELHGQLLEAGFNAESLQEVVDFVKNDTNLYAFAKEVPNVFAKTRGQINAKLASQGLGGVAEFPIDKTKLNEAQTALLNSFYDGEIPAGAVYTPFTAEGDIDIDFTAKPYDTYNVMSGNLKARTGKGRYRVNSLSSGVSRYVGEGGPIRTGAFLNFAKNLQGMMTKDNMNKMSVAYGPTWTKNMESMVRSIVTGQNTGTIKDPTTRAVYGWLRNAIGNVMFLNVRSAALQLLSFSNYAVADPKNWMDGVIGSINDRETTSQVWEALKATNWMENRQQGGTDPIFDELFKERQQGKFMSKYNQLTKFGYTLTKKGDMAAILMGGVPYMVGRVKNGATIEDAVKDFISKAEETQQSARPERLSVQQKTVFGKLALAFMNTPLQYGRKTARLLRDAAAKGTPIGERVKLVSQASYYGMFAGGLFTALQGALNPFGDDDDEVSTYWERLLGQMMTYAGIQGQVLNTIWQQGLKISEGEKFDAAKALVDIFPAISTKARKFQKGFGNKTVYQGGDGLWEYPKEVYQAGDAINATTGFPADRFIYLSDQVNDVFARDLDAWDKMQRAFGWSRYSIGESAGKAH